MKPLALLLVAVASVSYASAQVPDTTAHPAGVEGLTPPATSVHGQVTVIHQRKPGFTAPYTGTNSLQPDYEFQTSITSTLFLTQRLWRNGLLVVNPEIAGGSGLSGALGIASAANGETFRIGSPDPKIYLARLYLRQQIPLSREKVAYEPDVNDGADHTAPKSYLNIIVGKTSLADYLDANDYSHDPRSQFMSWGLMDNGAWDYAANTRGYTPSVVLEWVRPHHEWRYAFSLLPKDPNGSIMNWDLGKSQHQSVEYTYRYQLGKQPGALRVLGFLNRTYLGDFAQAVIQAAPVPDLGRTRGPGRSKYGFTLNAEQAINDRLGVFARAGWNDGKTETWCFTQIDRTLSAGGEWKLPANRIFPAASLGLGYVLSGISRQHRDYLAKGGLGFIIGDGALSFRPEHLTELYYQVALKKDVVWFSLAYQLVVNPAYNRDRSGPVNIFSGRAHVEF